MPADLLDQRGATRAELPRRLLLDAASPLSTRGTGVSKLPLAMTGFTYNVGSLKYFGTLPKI